MYFNYEDMTLFRALIYASAVLVLIYIYAIRGLLYWKKRKVPYVTPIPFLGNLLNIFLMKSNFGEQLSTLYFASKGPFCGIFMLNRPALMLRDPALIKKLLVNNSDTFTNRFISDGSHENDNSRGMFVAKNQTWKDLRKTVIPAFSSLNNKTLLTRIESCNEKMLGYLREKTTSNSDVDARDICCRYSIEAVCFAFFELDAECFSRENSPWKVMGEAFFDYRSFRIGVNVAMSFISPKISKIFGMNLFDQATFNFVTSRVTESLEKKIVEPTTKYDYLDILKKAAEKLQGGEQVFSSAVEIFAAGSETVAASLTFACYELAKNQNIQREVREEIKAVAGGKKEALRDKFQQMTYLDLFVKELYRKYPLNPFLERVGRQDFSVENPKLTIDKGIGIYVPVLGIHHDPEYYPEPQMFRPERFVGDVNWSVYFPFGIGPRMCIARKYAESAVKLGIANLVRNFELKCSSRTPEKLTFNSKGFTLQISGNLFLEVHHLNTSD